MTKVTSKDLYEWPMHNETATCEDCGEEIDVPAMDDPNGDMKAPHWRRDRHIAPVHDSFDALCGACYADEVSAIINETEGSA